MTHERNPELDAPAFEADVDRVFEDAVRLTESEWAKQHKYPFKRVEDNWYILDEQPGVDEGVGGPRSYMEPVLAYGLAQPEFRNNVRMNIGPSKSIASITKEHDAIRATSNMRHMPSAVLAELFKDYSSETYLEATLWALSIQSHYESTGHLGSRPYPERIFIDSANIYRYCDFQPSYADVQVSDIADKWQEIVNSGENPHKGLGGELIDEPSEEVGFAGGAIRWTILRDDKTPDQWALTVDYLDQGSEDIAETHLYEYKDGELTKGEWLSAERLPCTQSEIDFDVVHMLARIRQSLDDPKLG